jgi:hypothetical protein
MFISIGKCADVSVAQQPRDLRNGEILVGQIALRKSNAEMAQYTGKF